MSVFSARPRPTPNGNQETPDRQTLQVASQAGGRKMFRPALPVTRPHVPERHSQKYENPKNTKGNHMKIDPQNVLAALHALGGHATNKQLAGALGVHGAKTRSGYRRVAAVTKALAAEGK